MWKVENKKNIKLLKQFEKKIIYPLFEFIIEVKKNKYSSKELDDIATIINSSSLDTSYPNHLFSLKGEYKKVKYSFGELIKSIVEAYSESEINAQFDLYKKQNKEIESGNYSIPKENVVWEFYVIFSKIFYDQCFDDLKCWDYVQKGLKYSRVSFHENFKNENSEICCLCDTDSTIAKSNGIVEHFLPRNNFSYLSMSGSNLTTSCHACNLSEEGKGTSVYTPIYSPYNIQIGDNIKFTFMSGKKIKISCKKGTNEVENYIKLVKLNERYCSKSVFNTSINRLKTEYDHLLMTSKLSKSKLKFDNIMDYIELRKTEGFYFFKKHIFSSLPQSEINKLFIAFKR